MKTLQEQNVHNLLIAKGWIDQRLNIAWITNFFKPMFSCQSKLKKISLRERKFQHFTIRNMLFSCQKKENHVEELQESRKIIVVS